MFRNRDIFLLATIMVMVSAVNTPAEDLSKQSGVVKMEFIFDKAPFKQCHASTIAETKRGLVAAWFGGTAESNADVGIWLSSKEGEKWSEPKEVANGIQHDKKRYPCWNPVLFQPKAGPLLLFYKVGPSPDNWWGMLKVVGPSGRVSEMGWRLPEDILGPVKNKPIQLPDGVLLCGSSTEDKGWRVHFERSKDMGRTWEFIGPINDGKEFGAIQPTLLTYADGRIQALCRSQQSRITESWSSDAGRTWSKMVATSLPNPNSGIDAVTLSDGRQLLVYNHTADGRSPLNVAVSEDGKVWKAALVLEDEPGEYSYPAVIQTSDGMVHTTYTWKRRKVKHVVIDPAKLVERDMVNGEWPK
ncbi:MAG: sialidase family protein [Planctomycetota bacterium]